MIGDILEIGDEVMICVPKENRDWGYNPAPNGTKGKIVGFGEIDWGRACSMPFPPGIYRNRQWVDVLLETGGKINIGSFCLVFPQDGLEERGVGKYGKEELRRLELYWANKETLCRKQAREFLRNLPETTFWEGDLVRCNAIVGMGNNFLIDHINYLWIGDRREDGSQIGFYHISPPGGGWMTMVGEEDLTLLERGNVWHHYHGEPLSFKDLKEELNFYRKMGQSEELKNPASGNYAWTLKEALTAIKAGTADAISVGGYGPNPITFASKFNDRELGKKSREMTLKGFADMLDEEFARTMRP